MGFLGDIAANAQKTITKKQMEAKFDARMAAMKKAAQQDEGWNYQMRIKCASTSNMQVEDKSRRLIYEVGPGFPSLKHTIVIKNAEKAKVATLKSTLFKGIGVSAALEVAIGETPVGKIILRKPNMMNGYDYAYHFEPLGLTLKIEGVMETRYIIASAYGVAIVYRCDKYENCDFKINYNNRDAELLYLIMLVAKNEIC